MSFAAVVFNQWHTVVTVPGIKHSSELSTGHLPRLVERGLCVVGFRVWKSNVQSGLPFFFTQITMPICTSLQQTEANILVKAGLTLSLTLPLLCKCMATGMEVWSATSVVSSWNMRRTGCVPLTVTRVRGCQVDLTKSRELV